MIANYHTHTVRCGHAVGADREYVEAAISAGIKTLGFSDHTPYVGFDGDYYSGYRMRAELIEDYVTSVMNLKKEYEKDIKIYLGLETEYYPELFDGLMEFLSPYGIEYMILGEHFAGSDQYNPYVPTVTDAAGYEKYARLCCEAIKTGKFAYIAHPDIIGVDKSSPEFRLAMETVCKCAKENDIPLEINLLGLSTGRAYPCREFYEIAAENKNSVILGRDAHNPAAFADTNTEERALKIVEKYGLCLIDKLRLQK